MIRVGVVGAVGYAGRELIRLIIAHPEAELVAAVEVEGGKRLDELMPAFKGLTDVSTETFDAKALAENCDAVFMAVPAPVSMECGAKLRAAGVRTLDMGADFRIKDPDLYTQYYNETHIAPELLPEAVYGMAPFYREQIKDAQLVAVPGCYPTSVIIPLRPLMGHDAIDDVPIVVDAMSGVSGAGRKIHEVFHFPEMNNNVKAYKVGIHQHIPEIEQELLGKAIVQFTPHIGPYTRGILSTITVHLNDVFDPSPIYAKAYDKEPFVRVLGEGILAETKNVHGSTFCDFGWVIDKRTHNLVIVSAIDNLMGGTAGLAVQCMNIMFGLDERSGLNYAGMAP